jgi:dinuclear metal center YbgI/SA1388 family protein
VPSAGELSAYLDALLRTGEIPDYPNAFNGLQLQNRGEIVRVAAAVDFSSHTVDETIASGANFLQVHHGMYWGGLQSITGHVYARLSRLLANDVAVYGSHLPLDAHPSLGNNVLLARELGLVPRDGFARFKTIDVGVSGNADMSTTALVERARSFAALYGGSIVTTPFAPDRRTTKWGICTGAGADSNTLQEAAERGLDTLIVGEGPHHTAGLARDLGIVIIYAGHYATETLGVQALAAQLANEFGIATMFIDVPTGL